MSEQDTREKLEADVRHLCSTHGWESASPIHSASELILAALDRQAAITELEVEHDLMLAGRMAVEVERKRIADLQAQLDEVTRAYKERGRIIGELTAERDEAVEAYDAHMAAHDAWHEAEDITYTRNRFSVLEQAKNERIAKLEAERDKLSRELEAEHALAMQLQDDAERLTADCTDCKHLDELRALRRRIRKLARFAGLLD